MVTALGQTRKKASGLIATKQKVMTPPANEDKRGAMWGRQCMRLSGMNIGIYLGHGYEAWVREKAIILIGKGLSPWDWTS